MTHVARAALAALVLAGAVRAVSAEEPEEVQPRVSAGIGLGLPQLFHAQLGVWLTPRLSVDARTWVIPGLIGSSTYGVEGAVTGHLFEGKHRLLLQAGGLWMPRERADLNKAPFLAVGWERRGECIDFRLASGLMLVRYSDDHVTESEVIRDSRSTVFPMFTLTWVRRIPSNCNDSTRRARHPAAGWPP